MDRRLTYAEQLDESEQSEALAVFGNVSLEELSDQLELVDDVYDPYSKVQKNGVTLAKVYTMKCFWYLAALDVLHAMKAQLSPTALKALQDEYQQAVDGCTQMIKNGQDIAIIAAQELEHEFPVKLPSMLYKAIANATQVNSKNVRQKLRNAYIRQLNNQDWMPIRRTMDLANTTYVSTITPVNFHYHVTYGPGGKGYEVSGLCSMSTNERLTDEPGGKQRDVDKENKRTTNLAYTEFGCVDGPVLFAGFRSGALAGKGLGFEITCANTAELLEAMVIKHLQQHDNSIERFRLLHSALVGHLKVISINLQSAGIGGERQQIQGQKKGLLQFHRTETKFSLRWITKRETLQDQIEGEAFPEVKYTFDIIYLNIPTNAQGDKTFADLDDLAVLTDAADNYLQTVKPVDDLALTVKLQKIDELNKKVKSRKGAFQTYKLAARVANLAYLLGYMVHFNCKSGKDRTGLMDVETKFLAYRMDQAVRQNQSSLVSEYALKTKRDKIAFQKMLFESGNLEMQAYNTGGQGYKVAPAANALVPDVLLMRRIGGKTMLTNLRGLDRYTDIDHI